MMQAKCIEIERNEKMWPCYVPTTQASVEAMRKHIDKSVNITVKKERSPEQHRFYFKMIEIGFNNQVAVQGDIGYFPTAKALRKGLQIEAGHFDLEQRMGGEMVKVSKSVDHANMKQDDFNILVSKVRDLICEFIVPGMNPETLMTETAQQSGVRNAIL